MNIEVVCKLNQARSIIASAALRKIYPNFNIMSSGVNAHSMEPIPEIISIIASKWAFRELDLFSTQYNPNRENLFSDLIICADNLVYKQVLNSGSHGIIVDSTNYALTDFLLPSDPVYLSLSDTELELAKMIVTSNMAVRANLPAKLNITGVLYHEQSSSSLIRFLKEWQHDHAGIIIDMNWKIPESEIWISDDFDCISFNPRDPNIQDNIESNKLYFSIFEIDNQVDLITSPKWLQFLQFINKPILLLIGPLINSNAMSPDQIISLLHANKVRIIGS